MWAVSLRWLGGSQVGGWSSGGPWVRGCAGGGVLGGMLVGWLAGWLAGWFETHLSDARSCWVLPVVGPVVPSNAGCAAHAQQHTDDHPDPPLRARSFRPAVAVDAAIGCTHCAQPPRPPQRRGGGGGGDKSTGRRKKRAKNECETACHNHRTGSAAPGLQSQRFSPWRSLS